MLNLLDSIKNENNSSSELPSAERFTARISATNQQLHDDSPNCNSLSQNREISYWKYFYELAGNHCEDIKLFGKNYETLKIDENLEQGNDPLSIPANLIATPRPQMPAAMQNDNGVGIDAPEKSNLNLTVNYESITYF